MVTAEGLAHRSVLHRGADDLADQVAADVRAGLERGDAVLVCLPDDEWSALADRLGSDAAAVDQRPVGDRYTQPVVAMSVLWDFVGAALAAGRPAVQSIGTIAYTGTPADSPWLRYEAAVNAVFRDLPVTAVCTTDVRKADPSLVAALAHVHDHATGELDRQRVFVRGLEPANRVPDRSAEVELHDTTPGEARKVVASALGDRLTERQRNDLALVVTELLTNAARYGPGGHTLRLWVERDSVLVAASDGGPGPSDLAAGLRPVGLATGGRGLWIVHHLCDPVDLRHTDEGFEVLARLAVPPA